MLTAVMVIAGLVLLAVGGEALVRGSVTVARRLGVSPAVIGLTLVAFGTSAPELVVSIQAALTGHETIVLGNVVGSNIANLLLIVGAVAAAATMVSEPRAVRRDGGFLLLGTGIFIALCFAGDIGLALGAAMVLVLFMYSLWSFRTARREELPDPDDVPSATGPPIVGLMIAVAGILGVVIGARLLIDGAVEVARLAGLSEAVIGLTLVAFGTSLPELVASLIAAVRRHGDLAIGNVIGSNLFNMFGITGATAMVREVPVPGEILTFDIWVMLAATLVFLGMVLYGGRIGRRAGVAMLVAYGAYIAFLASGGSFAAAAGG